jgi:group I intron endonuclease
MAITINGSGTITAPVFAYIHCRPDGSPYYVGKGIKKRMRNFKRRNPYHTNVTNKYGKENILIGMLECSSDEIAFNLERGLIKCLKNSGVNLTNIRDGGEGFEVGNRPWNTGKKLTDAHKEKCRVASQGTNNPFYKKKHTEEFKNKMSALKQGKSPSNKGIKVDRIDCPHCGKNIDVHNAKRWHMDNCKELAQ